MNIATALEKISSVIDVPNLYDTKELIQLGCYCSNEVLAWINGQVIWNALCIA